MDFLTLPQIDIEGVNDTIRTPHIAGEMMWQVQVWKKFWAGVASGELGLNPKGMFGRRHTNLGEYVN